MEITALRILWDDDDEDLDLDVEFLEDLYACWSGLKSQRYMAPREHGSSGRHTGIHVLKPPHLLIFGNRVPGMDGIRLALLHPCENSPEAATIFLQSDGGRPSRPTYQQIATALYILGASGGGAGKIGRAHV